MSKSRSRQGDPGTAELEVLKVLWESGPATVREVMNRLHALGRKVAYTTVLTFLTRLEQKGFVRANKSGVAYIYRPLVSREKIFRSRVRTVLNQFFDGAAGPLVLQLMREERFTADEIAQLQEMLDELDDSPGRSPTS